MKNFLIISAMALLPFNYQSPVNATGELFVEEASQENQEFQTLMTGLKQDFEAFMEHYKGERQKQALGKFSLFGNQYNLHHFINDPNFRLTATEGNPDGLREGVNKYILVELKAMGFNVHGQLSEQDQKEAFEKIFGENEPFLLQSERNLEFEDTALEGIKMLIEGGHPFGIRAYSKYVRTLIENKEPLDREIAAQGLRMTSLGMFLGFGLTQYDYEDLFKMLFAFYPQHSVAIFDLLRKQSKGDHFKWKRRDFNQRRTYELLSALRTNEVLHTQLSAKKFEKALELLRKYDITVVLPGRIIYTPEMLAQDAVDNNWFKAKKSKKRAR